MYKRKEQFADDELYSFFGGDESSEHIDDLETSVGSQFDLLGSKIDKLCSVILQNTTSQTNRSAEQQADLQPQQPEFTPIANDSNIEIPSKKFKKIMKAKTASTIS